MSKKQIKIGTRGSALALTQTAQVEAALQKLDSELKIETVIIKTSGDWKPEHGETRLSEAAGGKGQFAREIEEKLLQGEIDCAVHSVKDMESHLTPGLSLQHFLSRGDCRDAFVSEKYQCLNDMPHGSVVGTSSVRRGAIVLNQRPDIEVVPLRGNVPTRLEKLSSGQVDATFLAVAGLNRLNMSAHITKIMDVENMLPGAGQGTIGMEIRECDPVIEKMVAEISCPQTTQCTLTERAAIAVLDGSCHTPIGALAEMKGQQIYFRLAVYALDGRNYWMEEGMATASNASALGQRVAERLKTRLPQEALI